VGRAPCHTRVVRHGGRRAGPAPRRPSRVLRRPSPAVLVGTRAPAWWLSGLVSPGLRRLGEDTVPQECTAGTAIALALEQLQAVDMALDGTIAPGQGEARCDCREILPQALGQAGERLNPTGRGLGDPGLQGLAPAFPHERQKGLAQCRGLRHGGVALAEVLDIPLGVLRPLRGGAPPGKRDGPGRRPLWARGRGGLRLGGPSGLARPPQPGDQTGHSAGGVSLALRPQLAPALPAVRAALPPALDYV
jgi:hypothetical protein